jgi:hypothetical protein
MPKRSPDRRIGEFLYRPVVLLVRTRNADGTVGLLEHLRDDDVQNVADSEGCDLLIGYLPVRGLES